MQGRLTAVRPTLSTTMVTVTTFDSIRTSAPITMRLTASDEATCPRRPPTCSRHGFRTTKCLLIPPRSRSSRWLKLRVSPLARYVQSHFHLRWMTLRRRCYTSLVVMQQHGDVCPDFLPVSYQSASHLDHFLKFAMLTMHRFPTGSSTPAGEPPVRRPETNKLRRPRSVQRHSPSHGTRILHRLSRGEGHHHLMPTFSSARAAASHRPIISPHPQSRFVRLCARPPSRHIASHASRHAPHGFSFLPYCF